MRLFLDTDVVLDYLADRPPLADHAHRVIGMGEAGLVTLHVSSLTFSNVYYLLCKWNGRDSALAALRQLARLVQVADVPATSVSRALASNFPDFEDALQYFSAETIANLDRILTRNQRDWGPSRIPILSAEEFLWQWEGGGA